MENPILSGSFTSNGNPVSFSFRTPIQNMWVYNYTQIATPANVGQYFYWQRGMVDATGNSTGVVWTKAGAGAMNVTALTATTGFTPIDTSLITIPTLNAFTGITSATSKVLTATPPPVGTVVRLTSVAVNPQLAGIDYLVTGVDAGVGFFINTIAMTGLADSGAGKWQVVPYNPIFYPRIRSITYIAPSSTETVPAGLTRIFTSVPHQYVPGMKVNLQFPGSSALWGNFYNLQNVEVTVVAVNTAPNGNQPTATAAQGCNYDVAFNSAGYGQWLNAVGPVTYLPAGQYNQAVCIPIGENMAFAIAASQPNPAFPLVQTAYNTLQDSLTNNAILGITLAGGAGSPGGANGDLMFWTASASFDGQTNPIGAQFYI